MLAARLVLGQGRRVRMKAKQRHLEALAPGDGVGNGRSSHNEALVLDAREGFEGFEFSGKGVAVRRGDVLLELEEDCKG